MRITFSSSSILMCALAVLPMFGADMSPNAKQIFDKQLDASEHEVMALLNVCLPRSSASSPEKVHSLPCDLSAYKLGTSRSV